MRRFVQILFLWLAGIGLLGHLLIPHHHHNNSDEACAQENIETEHQHHSDSDCTHEHNDFTAESNYFAENCANHSHDHEQACSFQNHSFIEKGNTVLTATIISLLTIKKDESRPINYLFYQAKKAKDTKYQFRPNRAPPVIA